MASRSTSSTQRPPSSTSQHPSQSSTTIPRQRNYLSQTHIRRPPTAPKGTRQPPGPTPSRAPSKATAKTLGDGTNDDSASDTDSDIIVSRPQNMSALPDHRVGSTNPVAHPESMSPHADSNAQAMADAMLIQHTQARHDGMPQGVADLGVTGSGGQEDGTARLIEMYRRRERDREQVDQEELKTALWESLGRKVKSLEEDRWMYEMEEEVGVDAG